MKFLCPVCGYRDLEDPPQDFTICPSCGTEFGHDDFGMTFAATERRWSELRWEWFRNGARWWDNDTATPVGWDPYQQLLEAGLVHDIAQADATQQHEIVRIGVAWAGERELSVA